jgi:hypothetical protein
MQTVPIPASRFGHNRNKQIAGIGIGQLQSGKCGAFASASFDQNRSGALCRKCLRLFGHNTHVMVFVSHTLASRCRLSPAVSSEDFL